MNKITIIFLALVAAAQIVSAAQEDQALASANNATSITKKLFTYSGPLLPSDWTLVSTLNERAVIGFNNGSARNALIEELDPKDRVLLQKLLNGTLSATPLQGAKEKLGQWSSQFSSTVTKLGKSFREQLDSLINKDKNKDPSMNVTTMLVN